MQAELKEVSESEEEMEELMTELLNSVPVFHLKSAPTAPIGLIMTDPHDRGI